MDVSLEIVAREVPVALIDELPASLPVSVAITDLDGFGVFNDANGRDAGNAVLATFEQALEQNLPDESCAHRVGGDEWLITFPGLALENSLLLLEELRSHVATAMPGGAVTMSAGVAARPPHGSTGDELIRAADEALSRCKRDGGNRVGIYIEDKMVMKSNYYPRATLDRLASLSRATNRTEASLLREAADKLLAEYAGSI